MKVSVKLNIQGIKVNHIPILGVRMSLTKQDISQPSLCHLSLGSSMVRASQRRSECCRFDSRLGHRNIFWVCESLSSQKVFL